MKTICAIVVTLGLFAAAGYSQPTITQVSNSASSSLSPLQNSSIAQGSFFTIYGSGFGPSALAEWAPYPLPTTLGNCTVQVTVNGTTVQAYLFVAIAPSATFSQINAVLPSNTPTGTGTITVTSNGTTSAAFPITVAASSFGTFSRNQAGSGPGSITDAANNLITPFHTAKPNDIVILWGTGLGPVADVADEQNQPPTQINLCAAGANCPVTVWVGTQEASVLYAGRAAFTAEDQINFRVPAGTQGCYIQVAVQIGQVVGNFTSMSVDPNGAACQDADGINYGDISTQVTANGKASVGVISMLSNYLTIPGLAQWDNDTVNGEIGTFSTQALDEFQGYTLSPSVSNCTVSQFEGFPPPSDPALGLVDFLDAGTALTIQGPTGSPSVPKNPSGAGYGALVGGATIAQIILGNGAPSFYLDANNNPAAATYTVSGPGGTQVGAFSGSLTVSSAAASFKWDQTAFTAAADGTPAKVSRTSPLTITWTGGDPQGFVDITAIGSTTARLEPLPTEPGILVECLVPASLNSFTIPTFVLGTLPATSATAPIGGEILVGPASGAVKITAPTGLDAAYLFYHFINGTTVSWQ